MGVAPVGNLTALAIDAIGQVAGAGGKSKTHKIIGANAYAKNTEQENGNALRNSCLKYNMSIADAWYGKRKAKTEANITRITPNNTVGRQIDYICVNKRYANPINNCKPAKGWKGNVNQNCPRNVIVAKL